MEVKIEQSKKREIVYVFIDSQNLNLGISKDIVKNGKIVYQGWCLDFEKFYKYLKNKFKASKTFLFIGYIKENEKLYSYLKSCGYQLVFKPTVKDGLGRPKGNVDAELVLQAAAIDFKYYDKAVIVSGDGDFACLHRYLERNCKLGKIIIPNRYSESSLLVKFQRYKVFLNREKEKLSRPKKGEA